MKSNFFTIIIFFLCLSCNIVQAQKNSIDKGIIKGNFDISFTDKNIVLKSGQEFSLSQLGIEANKKSDFDGPTLSQSGIPDKNSWWWNKFFTYYPVKIHSYYTNKDYYGAILFFNATKKCKNDAVCQSYEINIQDSYFDKAQSGEVTYSYEYYPDASAYHKSRLTWIVLFKNKP